MKQEIAMKWADALETYKQGTSVLHQVVDGQPCFCFFGVLSALAVQDGIGRWVNSTYCGSLQSHETNGNHVRHLAVETCQWAGIYGIDEWGLPQGPHEGELLATLHAEFPEQNLRPPTVSGSISLSDINDRGATFPQLAAFVRKHWELL